MPVVVVIVIVTADIRHWKCKKVYAGRKDRG